MLVMLKRKAVVVVSLVVVAAVIGTLLYMYLRPTTLPIAAEGIPYAKAKKMPVVASCVDENHALHLTSEQRNGVEQGAMSYLYDVPAGTNVDIMISAYSQNAATGSARYPAKYGSYNFTLQKDTRGDWRFTTYEHCA